MAEARSVPQSGDDSPHVELPEPQIGIAAKPNIKQGLGNTASLSIQDWGHIVVVHAPLLLQTDSGKSSTSILSQLTIEDSHGIRGLAAACVVAEHSKCDQLLNLGY